MGRAVNQLAIQPILYPRGSLIVVVHGAVPALQQGVVHLAFGSRNDQFELLMSAVVEVLAGIVIVKVAVEVLSEPKSNTAIDLLPWVAL